MWVKVARVCGGYGEKNEAGLGRLVRWVDLRLVAKGGKVGEWHVTFSRIKNRVSPSQSTYKDARTHRRINGHRLSPTAATAHSHSEWKLTAIRHSASAPLLPCYLLRGLRRAFCLLLGSVASPLASSPFLLNFGSSLKKSYLLICEALTARVCVGGLHL